ncbi:MAG: tetratricopeptide repeat protein [Muribaculaceae bacterium]|nr:tetratricopeptide repeat protein [Muribaculaceae bacterium]
MDKSDISKYKKLINQLLDSRQLVLALKNLKTMVDDSQQWELSEELKQLTTSYHYMLQYMSQGVLDPQRDSILAQIFADAYLLTDKTVIALASSQSTHIFYQRNQQYKNCQLHALVEEYVVKLNKLQLLNDDDSQNNSNEAEIAILRQCETLESDIFNKVWSTFPATTADVEAITSLLGNDKLPAHLKSLVLSALMLGLSKFFDAAKLKLLLNSYVALADTDLKLRALINAVIIIFLYRNRIAIYSDVLAALKQLEDEPDFVSDIQLIFTRLIHSRNTENISQKLHDIITPELNKMSSELLDKIKGKTPGTLDISDIEENPQWQEWLDNSGITSKLEELNELQLQGGDVFISTFSKLKSLPFFNILSNWFLPYHDKSSIMKSAFGNKKHPITTFFTKMPFLCDSDKYSILLYTSSAPESQRNIIFHQFDAQREQIQELQSEETQSVIKMRDNIVNRYIQDLYRFFKLFSRRREFMSIFDTDIKLADVECLKPYISDTPTLSVIAEFYFKNGFYEDAIKYYREMVANRDADPHVYQKIAFAQQSLGKHREALKNYSRYELVDSTDTWNTKQMAQCYRSLRDYDTAIEYYNKALDLSPQSVVLCLNLGHCYLDKGDYDNALQQYYKADFMPKAKHRAWRPIAWCSLLTGKHEQAVNYYEKIINDDTPSSQDHLNYGHVLQVMGHIADAINQYRKSLQLEGNDAEAFSKLYLADAKYVVNKMNIPASDFALVLDAAIQST